MPLQLANRSEKQVKKRRCRGNSIIEVTFMAPWILFLMMGVFDFGFWAYAGISAANAARVAALHISSDPLLTDTTQHANALTTAQATACDLVKQELRYMLNASGFSGCTAAPLTVNVTRQAGPDGSPSARVTVAYQLIPLFMIPGLGGQWSVTRAAEMRVAE
jgi:Flp pilus assembly protein TadG